jgi:hypothetical protein
MSKKRFELRRLNEMENQIIRFRALASKVLAVAVITQHTGTKYDWACYIDSVPGIDHSTEHIIVAKNGDKQHESVAEVLFPELDIKNYRR